MEDERRKWQRREFRGPIQYRKGDSEALKGSVAYDISEGGLKFHSEDFIALHTPLNIQMAINSEKIIQLYGQVVWIQMMPHAESYQVGYEFADSDEILQAKRVIQQYVQAQA